MPESRAPEPHAPIDDSDLLRPAMVSRRDAASQRLDGSPRVPHAGMPPLEQGGKVLSHFEFWPGKWFYLPVYLHWALMCFRYGKTGLPMIANPNFPMGGMVNESKIDIFEAVKGEARAHFAPYTFFRRSAGTQGQDGSVQDGSGQNPDARLAADTQAAIDAIRAAGMQFPLVVKPDIGCRGAGVRRLWNRAELTDYLRNYDDDQGLIFQEWIDSEGEAGVFYVRLPNEEKGRIFSLTLKYFPYVIGDGQSTLKQLILADPRCAKLQHLYLPRHQDRLAEVLPAGQAYRLVFAGSHSRGSIFRDGADQITPEMTDAFDRLARAIPEFYFGRFDVRFEDIEDMKAGHGFHIIEVNGASSEATHIWDRKITLRQAWGTIWTQFSLLWKVGYQNYKRGHKPIAGWKMLWLLYKEKKLTARHPATE